MTISAQYTQTTVADLLSAANNGEEVIIARPGNPLCVSSQTSSLRPHPSPPPEAANKRKLRILGALRGQMHVPSEEEWAEMDRQIAAEMNDRPLSGPKEMPGLQSVALEAGLRWVDKMTWPTANRPRTELLGSLAGQIVLAEDWDAPATNQQIQALFEGSDKAETIGSK